MLALLDALQGFHTPAEYSEAIDLATSGAMAAHGLYPCLVYLPFLVRLLRLAFVLGLQYRLPY